MCPLYFCFIFHDCIDSDMSITTLFRNEYFQLGINGTSENIGDESGEMGDDLAAVDLGNGFIPIDIEAGWYHACSMAESKAVKCWGLFLLSLSLFIFCTLITLQYIYRKKQLRAARHWMWMDGAIWGRTARIGPSRGFHSFFFQIRWLPLLLCVDQRVDDVFWWKLDRSGTRSVH